MTYIDYLLNKSVKHQFAAFREGFMKVCGGRVLELFQSSELMAVVTGNEDYDWHALEAEADYKNGYSSSDQVVIFSLIFLCTFRSHQSHFPLDSMVLGSVPRAAIERKEKIFALLNGHRSYSDTGNASYQNCLSTDQ